MTTAKTYLPIAALCSLLASTTLAQSVDHKTLGQIFNEPVTTSATGKPQRVSDVPMAMNIITADEIQRSGAQDIPQLLQRIAGVEVVRHYIGDPQVAIRGFNRAYANRILVLVNGRQVMQDHFGTTYWSMLPVQLDEIQQIEIVKGPNSSLFGFNAESGVINIITANPLNTPINQIKIGAGTQQRREASGIATQNFGDNTAARISIKTKITDGFNRDNFANSGTVNNKDANKTHEARMYNLDVMHQLDNNADLRFQSSHSNGHFDSNLPFYAAQTRVPISTTSNQLTYTADTQKGLWKLDAYHKSINWYPDEIKGESDLTVLKAENIFQPLKNHTFKVGGEYRYNSAKGELFGNGNSKFDYDLFSTSGMWEWQINDKLSWTNAGRYDHMISGRDENATAGSYTSSTTPYDRTIEEISFNSGILYKPTETDKFHAKISRGVHIPSLVEMGGGTNVSGGVYYGDPSLQPERILSIEAGYSKRLIDYDTTIGANIFMQKMENTLGTAIVQGPPLAFEFRNVGDAEAFGVELEAKGLYDEWLNWGANYTYMNVTDNPNGGEMVFEGTQPKHQVSVYGGFDAGKWEFNSDLNWISDTRYRVVAGAANPPASSIREEQLDNYFVLNARVGYNYSPNTVLSIDGYNLIDKHREILNTTGGFGGDVGGETLGRSVMFNVKHTFK